MAQFDEIRNVSAININAKSGLPTNYVNVVFKDSYGFYWIGTQAGLCIYDGYKLHLFKNNPKDSFSLKCSNIFSVAQYKHYILIGCENGLTFYNHYTGKFLKNKLIEKTLKQESVFNLFVLNNHLYIASEGGLFQYNFKDSSIIQYKLVENRNDNPNVTFTSDCKFFYNKQHFLIYDIDFGIKKIDTIHHTIYGDYDYYNKRPRGIYQYGNSIYVLYSLYGIVKADASTLEKINDVLIFKNVSKSETEGTQSITSLKNNLYIRYKHGILEFNPLTLKTHIIQINDAPPNLEVKKLFNIDNNLVVTSVSNGIYIIPYSIQKIFNPIPESINSNFSNTYAIAEYQSGKILIGGNEKLYLYNMLTNNIEKDFSKYFKNINILYITLSHKKDEILIGTYGQGLYSFNLKTEKLKNIVKKGDYLCLYLDNDDTLWVGTLEEGLWKVNINTEKKISAPDFTKQTINFIKKSDNHFWIATNIGLVKTDKSGKIIFALNEKNKKLSNDWVYHFTEDSNYIYIATDNGLTVFNKKDSTSKFFYDIDGLPSSTILSVYLDKNNNLWIQTLKGISKMILSRLNNSSLKLFDNYSYIEGLVNYEFDQNAHALLKNNYLLYGGTSGIDIINPSKIKSTFSSIPTYITSFKISGKDYPSDTNVIHKKFFEIDWKQNNFQIEITAINPLASDKILYKYQLEGYDDEYSHPSPIRYISYTGLPGGTYKLKILATNYDGEWNSTPYYIYLKVNPPFWKTTWFIISASILVFGGIFGFNQYRTYQIKKRNKELEEKVAERTHELAQKNHEIMSSIEYAKRIQQAILPTHQYIQSVLPNAFILYIPKDIVSGDFYWIYEVNNKNSDASVIVASVDCTGHGVPGALMSMIGNNLLNQIVTEKNITSPDKILQELNKGVQYALKQGQSDIQTNDGMDAAVIQLFKDGKLFFSGAYRPLVIVRSTGELEKTDGNKYPIGGVQMDADRTYTLHQFQLHKGDSIYLFSDGYADQFGGEKGKKIMMKRFLQILQEIHLKPLGEQKEILEKFFITWKGEREQVDDVLVIGITCV